MVRVLVAAVLSISLAACTSGEERQSRAGSTRDVGVQAGGLGEPSSPPSDPVQLRAEVDPREVRPGETFAVLVRLEMEPGWHVYGRKVGEMGLPTVVSLALPDGATLRESIWPPEQPFSVPGIAEGMGYEGTLVVRSMVEAPHQIAPGNSMSVKVDASWLACSDVCIPMDASLELPVKIADARAEDATGAAGGPESMDARSGGPGAA